MSTFAALHREMDHLVPKLIHALTSALPLKAAGVRRSGTNKPVPGLPGRGISR
jgi:hypothetical protein